MVILDRHGKNILGPVRKQPLAIDLVVGIDDDTLDLRFDALVYLCSQELEQIIDIAEDCLAADAANIQIEVVAYKHGNRDIEIVGTVMHEARECLLAFLDLFDLLVCRVHEVQFFVTLGQLDSELIAFGLELELLLQERLGIGKRPAQRLRRRRHRHAGLQIIGSDQPGDLVMIAHAQRRAELQPLGR